MMKEKEQKMFVSFLFFVFSLRQFQIQPTQYQNLPRCQPCSCFLNVSDGRYVS